jgi:cell division protein FtsQ
MFKLILKIVACVVLIGYLAVAGVVYHLGDEPMRYREVSIHICDTAESAFLHASDIRRMMSQAGISAIGKEVSTFNTDELSQRLEQNKLVRRADCYHTPDSILRIDIYQRHPIMRVMTSRGSDFYIDREGELMPVQSNAPAMHLPLATGEVTPELARGPLYEFAQFLQKNRFWRSEITQIHVRSDGDVELIPRVGQHVILMGPLTDYEAKLKKLLTFYDKVPEHRGWNAYRVINLKFKGQVIGERSGQ